VNIPYITADQMREVDRVMVEEYGILLIQMMENAGRNPAHLARSRFLGGDPRDRRVLVLVGTGGNGGGGLACARRLHGWGAKVQVSTSAPPGRFQGTSATQLDIVQRLNVPVAHGLEDGALPASDLIVDAIIGYSLMGAPRGAAATLILAANAQRAPVLSLDVPSGIDATTGEAYDPAVRSTATLTLALPKTGLRAPAAAPHVGELYLADIGVPPELYSSMDIGPGVGEAFASNDIHRLR
jgi:NAD(P)H-hydrate epimerase